MYEYIRGVVTSIKEKSIVIESNNIGYLIYIGNNNSFILNEDIKLYIYQSVKEDSLDLYGFKTIEEKDLFLLLLSVKGIGPKSAITTSSSTSSNILYQAINKGDVKYLSSFPGIGPKAAQQIIIDLKNKIKNNLFINNDNSAEALDALIALGYSKNVVITTFNGVDTSQSVDVVIKESLNLLRRA